MLSSMTSMLLAVPAAIARTRGSVRTKGVCCRAQQEPGTGPPCATRYMQHRAHGRDLIASCGCRRGRWHRGWSVAVAGASARRQLQPRAGSGKKGEDFADGALSAGAAPAGGLACRARAAARVEVAGRQLHPCPPASKELRRPPAQARLR